MNIRSSQSAGLGSAAARGHSIDISQSKLQQAKRWSQAQERYNKLSETHSVEIENPPPVGGVVQTAGAHKKPVVTRMTFVKKSTIAPDSSQTSKTEENT